jgi:predicted HD phosphohydrolase
MTSRAFAERFVDRLFDLFAQQGQRHYGEGVSQLDHALQTAHHAALDGASPALIAASLLHDVGHLLQRLGEDAADRGLDDQHERIGARYLARAFGPAVTEPVLWHVDAKRYLAAFEPGYRARLSPASLQSLALQGGPMGRPTTGSRTTAPTISMTATSTAPTARCGAIPSRTSVPCSPIASARG